MKPIEDVCKPAPGSTFLSYRKRNPDGSLGDYQNLDLEYYHKFTSRCALPDEAPEDVRKLWDVARNLLLYAYFEQTFFVASDLYCAMVVELTMRNACPDEIAEEKLKREKRGYVDWEPGFGWLLPKFKERLKKQLNDEELEFLFSSLEATNWLRNDFAHPKDVPLLGVNTSMLNLTSHWLGAYYKGNLKQAILEWMESAKKFNDMIKNVRESAE
jgi:hypothetical protein